MLTTNVDEEMKWTLMLHSMMSMARKRKLSEMRNSSRRLGKIVRGRNEEAPVDVDVRQGGPALVLEGLPEALLLLLPRLQLLLSTPTVVATIPALH